MKEIIYVKYNELEKQPEIIYNNNYMDVSLLKDMPIQRWVYPFFTNGIRWKGIYEELKAFSGQEEFSIFFDSDENSFDVMKEALSETPVKLIKNSNVVIVYKENPFITKITVDGDIFDTSRIQNRSIDEWLFPFQIRDLKWDGIFSELETYIGTETYTVNFVGKKEFINMLIDNCPNTVSIFSKNIPIIEKKQATLYSSVAPAIEKTLETTKDTFNKIVTAQKNNDVIEENKSLFKNAFLNKHIITILSAAILIFNFFNFVRITADDEIVQLGGSTMKYSFEPQKVSSYEALFGIKHIVFGTNKTIFAIFLFLIPIILILVNYLKICRMHRGFICAISSTIGLIGEFATYLDLRRIAKRFDAPSSETHVMPWFGFGLILLTFLLILAIGLYINGGIRIKKHINSN